MRSWGRLPAEVVQELRRLEWDNASRLRDRLLGLRGFPISQPLKPPTASHALADINHFHTWVDAWRHWPSQEQVVWTTRQYRVLGGQVEVPERLELDSVQALIEALGTEAVQRAHGWQARMQPLLTLDKNLYETLIRQLHVLETLSMTEVERLSRVLPQLREGMGEGRYLRALPVRGIDTKFLETHRVLLSALLDAQHQGAVTVAGGLEAWLRCRATPSNWLYVRPLCEDVRRQMGGFAILQLPLEQLLEQPLPGRRVLVVENTQAGYALPELPDTVAVFGGGRNTLWLQAPWLEHRHLAYWGDVDTWGLQILAEARQAQPNLLAVMMDEVTLRAHHDQGGPEREAAALPDAGLLPAELRLFEDLLNGTYGIGRLEQEFLDQDFIQARLTDWVKKTGG
jgi:hypothetical protein